MTIAIKMANFFNKVLVIHPLQLSVMYQFFKFFDSEERVWRYYSPIIFWLCPPLPIGYHDENHKHQIHAKDVSHLG